VSENGGNSLKCELILAYNSRILRNLNCFRDTSHNSQLNSDPFGHNTKIQNQQTSTYNPQVFLLSPMFKCDCNAHTCKGDVSRSTLFRHRLATMLEGDRMRSREREDQEDGVAAPFERPPSVPLVKKPMFV
jgi:hypothetical protein